MEDGKEGGRAGGRGEGRGIVLTDLEIADMDETDRKEADDRDHNLLYLPGHGAPHPC